ncbi:glucan endo-1,3-beta-glucosidase 8-like isoform X2 [Salvia miltiorrhiza]|uniref:glucan endo-1,3-beta-glucosidase 8-like isoform X2 n=1 Tax=Salvia miltiorrhiza TaxID=226208 RepID=UPI0025AC5434|nr:glucan endo-1,3-beta-glucosidase 8-like isoform X2 [Salvia miltiorrhiza]
MIFWRHLSTAGSSLPSPCTKASPCSLIWPVIIGSYVFTSGLRDKAAIEMTMVAMRNLQEALREVGYDGITVNLVHIQNMLKPNITRPSAADFSDEIRGDMIKFVRHLQEHKAPFLLDTFPILDARRNYFNFSFAFMDNTGIAIKDINGAVYTNVFEFTYDSIVWALTKINASDVKVVVTQVGWPTDGHVGATAANAERFYRHLLPRVAGNKGTPMRPGAPLDIFVHSLADETKMYYADPFTRHWGVYRSNGQPKYRIDLSGRGRNVYPVRMGGIMRMPGRWCIFNGNKTNIFYVRSQLEAACLKGDCSSTTIGGSCSQLSFEQNVSYAFNMVFQFKFQDERSCDFGGLARVSVRDPSTGECVFPVEVVEGQQLNFYLPT